MGEYCNKIVLDLFHNKIRINIGDTDVSVAQPTERKSNGTADIVKLCRRDNYSACKELKPPFCVKDSLAPTRSKPSLRY